MVLRRAVALADDLSERPDNAQRRLLHQLLHRVTLHPDKVQIRIRRTELEVAVFGETRNSTTQSQDMIELTAAVTMKRRGVEAKLIVGHTSDKAVMPDADLIALLLRAHRWFGQLARREVSSAREIARRHDPLRVE